MSCKLVQWGPDTYVHYRNTLTECNHAVCVLQSAVKVIHPTCIHKDHAVQGYRFIHIL